VKPRNFPGRRLRRQTRAYRRLFTAVPGRGLVLMAQSHEAFVLSGICRRSALYVEPPTDIRIRIGRAGRLTP
jgi:hypothetical protein